MSSTEGSSLNSENERPRKKKRVNDSSDDRKRKRIRLSTPERKERRKLTNKKYYESIRRNEEPRPNTAERRESRRLWRKEYHACKRKCRNSQQNEGDRRDLRRLSIYKKGHKYYKSNCVKIRAQIREYDEQKKDCKRKRQKKYLRQKRNRVAQFQDIKYLGENYTDETEALDIGGLEDECPHCGALSFKLEHGRVKHNCCHGGKIKLENTRKFPVQLTALYRDTSEAAIHFKKNIRYYNNAFSMATFCPKEEINMNFGSLKIRGETNAITTRSLVPKKGKKRMLFLKIIIIVKSSIYNVNISHRIRFLPSKCSNLYLQYG